MVFLCHITNNLLFDLKKKTAPMILLCKIIGAIEELLFISG